MEREVNINAIRPLVANSVDINELILSSKQHLETIFDSITDPILIVGPDLTIQRLNKPAATMMGGDFRDIIGHKCYERFHGRSGPCKDCPHLEVFRKQKSGSIKMVRKTEQGERIFDLRYFPLIDKSGKVKDVVEHYVDITEGEHAKARLEEEYHRIKTDLRTARNIQEALLPSALPDIPGVRIEVCYEPMEEIGGDLYDFINVDGENWGFLIADVSGHGIPASLMGAMAKMAFYNHTPNNLSTLDVLERVNKDLFNNLMMEYYISGAYMIFNSLHNTLRFSRAGHPDLLLYRKKSKSIEKLHTRGYFLGILANGEYEQIDLPVEKGDRLFLYTDGIVEAMNPEKEKFGLDRIRTLLLETSSQPLTEVKAKLLSEVQVFTQNKKAEDDLTFVLVEFTEDNCLERFGLRDDFGDPKVIQIFRALHPFDFGTGLSKVLEQMKKDWYPVADRLSVQMAAYEALDLLYKTSEDRSGGIFLAWSCDKEEVRVVIVDRRYDGLRVWQRYYEGEYPESIKMMSSKMSTVEFPDQGRKLRLIKRNSKY